MNDIFNWIAIERFGTILETTEIISEESSTAWLICILSGSIFAHGPGDHTESYQRHK